MSSKKSQADELIERADGVIVAVERLRTFWRQKNLHSVAEDSLPQEKRDKIISLLSRLVHLQIDAPNAFGLLLTIDKGKALDLLTKNYLLEGIDLKKKHKSYVSELSLMFMDIVDELGIEAIRKFLTDGDISLRVIKSKSVLEALEIALPDDVNYMDWFKSNRKIR